MCTVIKTQGTTSMNQVEEAEIHVEYARHGRTGLVSTVRSLCSGQKGREGHSRHNNSCP